MLLSEKLPVALIETTQVPADRAPAPASTIAQDASLLLVPLCFIAIWAGVVCIIADTWKLNRKVSKPIGYQAQLPCKKCQFFSSNPYIKCAVNPCVAMTPAAKECSDFRSRDPKAAHSNDR